MNPQTRALTRTDFETIVSALLNPSEDSPSGLGSETWLITLEGENSQFIRFNNTRVRQLGTVLDATFSITLLHQTPEGIRTADRSLSVALGEPLAGRDSSRNQNIIQQLQAEMARLRAEVPTLPLDPFATLPPPGESSLSERRAELLHREDAVNLLREPLVHPDPVDLAGIFASGTLVRGCATSTGARHWFETDSFNFDYSLYTPAQKALKNAYSGGASPDWDQNYYRQQLKEDRRRLEMLETPSRTIPRGEYRVYLGPQAVHEILEILADGALSESAIRQNESPLRHVRSGEKELSPLFHLTEDFRIGMSPRFNDQGILAPEVLPLISNGKLVNTLISRRTAAEYGLDSNGAPDSESLRSPIIRAQSQAEGGLREDEVLKRLGTGLYLSNLHYLNWSDQFMGRITGMTRYACFWVEDGIIRAPIRDLRFDESIFALFGSELEALTEVSFAMPSTQTYVRRQAGGSQVPGMLIRKMKFTL